MNKGHKFGSRNKRRSVTVALWMATAAATPMALMIPSMALVQGERSFDIPAGPLPDALVVFAAQSGLQVATDGVMVQNIRTAGVRGSMPAAAALGRLLNGTGLTYRINGTVVRLERAPQASSGAIQLGTVQVEGASGGAGGRYGPNKGTRFGDGGDTGDLAYVSPQSSSYITRDEIERSRGSQPSDIFRGTAGILSGDARNSGALDINIRGMQGMGRVPVVIDGSQQSTTVYRGYAGVASRTYLDPDLIGGIEVFKGPTGGVDGVGAVGGMVRMRTINAEDILLPGKTFGIRARGGFNTNSRKAPEPFTLGGLRSSMIGSYRVGCNFACGALDEVPSYDSVNQLGNPRGLNRPSWIKPTGGNASLSVAKSWDAIDLVGAVAYRNAGNYFAGKTGTAPKLTYTERTATLSRGREIYFVDVGYGTGLNRFRAGEEVLNTSSENLSFLVKATIRLADDHALELGYTKYKSWFGELMPSSIMRGDGALQAPMSKVDLDTYTARYKWDPASEWIELRINASRTELDNRIRTAYDFAWLDPTLVFIQPYDARTHRTHVDISNTAAHSGPLGDLTLSAGGSFSYESTYKIPGSAETTADGTPRDGWRREWSAFGDVQWLPVEFLKLNAGIRYTTFESYDRKPIQRWDSTIGALGEAYNIAYDQGGWAPIAAITMIPRSWLQVYARYSQAVRLPSLFEVTQGWSSNPVDDMKPERARNWEYGINISKDGLFAADDAVRAKLVYFNNNAKDYITRATGFLYVDPNERIRNIDRARFKGYEASFEYRNGPVAVELFGTHYTKTEFCTWVRQGSATRPRPSLYECSGGVGGSYGRNHVPPKWAGGGSVNLSLLDKKLDLFGRVTYTGTRPDEAVAAPGAVAVVEWNAYTLVDAQVRYKFNENIRVEVTADNLLDKYYMDALTLGLMASPGRTIRAGVTLNF